MNELSTVEARHPPLRTTINLKQATKSRLDKNRAPGQCYEGFLCQLVDLWEKVKAEKEDYILNSRREE